MSSATVSGEGLQTFYEECLEFHQESLTHDRWQMKVSMLGSIAVPAAMFFGSGIAIGAGEPLLAVPGVVLGVGAGYVGRKDAMEEFEMAVGSAKRVGKYEDALGLDAIDETQDAISEV